MSNFPLFPLWRITGTVALKTPLHIGSGRIAGIRLPERDGADTDRTVATVVRDVDDRPCIPGASFKGALGALARAADGLDTDWLHKLFGAALSATATQPAALEVAYLHLAALPSATTGLPHADRPGHAHVAHLPHVARNRERGTAEDGLLFVQQVLPPGCSFRFEATLRGASPADVQRLLALLALAGHTDSPLRLGSDKAADQGRIGWTAGTILRVATAADVWKLAAAAPDAIDLWTSAAARPQSLQPDPCVKLATDRWLAMPALTLRFHTPFLVYQATGTKPKGPQDNTAPDGTPRTNHAGKGILPASSLHGALRQQAERILRTLGQATPAGWQVPAVQGLAQAGTLDLASVLFGAAGWRSVLRITDFQVTKGQEMVHDMVAIDRITGGGKDHAKFRIRAYDCPELTGQIQVDLHRLRRLAATGGPQALDRVQAALGLLARVLRDLDEGDIPLGYGASKGYGGCLAVSPTRFNDALQALADPQLRPEVVDAAFIRLFAPGRGATPDDSPTPAHSQQPTATSPTTTPASAPAAAASYAAAAQAGQFHNPYAFIPFGNLNTDGRLPWQPRTEATLQGHGHHRYAADRLHGRLVCRLQTRTPIFIGAGDGDTPNGQPVNKLPFKLNAKRALPATSLRGLISSLHESITCSALRVLDNQGFSYRRQTGDDAARDVALSAVGRVHVVSGKGSDNTCWIEMLTLPTLSSSDDYTLGEPYGRMVCGDEPTGSAFHKVLIPMAELAAQPAQNDFEQCAQTNFTGSLASGYWYLKLSPFLLTEWHDREGFYVDDGPTLPRYKDTKDKSTTYIIGQRPDKDAPTQPLSEREYLAQVKDIDGWVRGRIRSMAYPGRQLPGRNVRHHELFVPDPVLADGSAPMLWPCTANCLQRFRSLAAERTLASGSRQTEESIKWLPYAPLQTVRVTDRLEPQQGDLVFFKAGMRNGMPEVVELSYSSLWRGRVESVDPNTGHVQALLAGAATAVAQLDPANGRAFLSPSELLFGLVIPSDEAAPAQPATPVAFQSRLRIGNGRSMTTPTCSEPVLLKILASPKPPSPAMYFKRTGPDAGRGITKEQLAATPTAFALKGRKAYLHAHRQDGNVSKLDAQGNFAQGQAGASPWASINFDPRANKQKLRITPIAERNTFWFEVDFHNLTLAELQSLCASLQPFAGFEHKLGLGKPIGLGSVAIDVVRLQLVDRARRYLDTACGPAVRHHHLWRHADVPDDQLLPQHLRSTEASCALPCMADPATLAAEQMAALAGTSPGVHQALRLLGDPGQVVAPVHYPQLAGQPIETETYQWFVGNEKAGAPQALAALDQGSTALPVLTRTQQQKGAKDSREPRRPNDHQPHRNPRR